MRSPWSSVSSDPLFRHPLSGSGPPVIQVSVDVVLSLA